MKDNQSDKKIDFNKKNQVIFTMTSLLVASKYDELDEYIPLIRDL
jgi:cadmium resistance protein CadD (predicted permease)